MCHVVCGMCGGWYVSCECLYVCVWYVRFVVCMHCLCVHVFGECGLWCVCIVYMCMLVMHVYMMCGVCVVCIV